MKRYIPGMCFESTVGSHHHDFWWFKWEILWENQFPMVISTFIEWFLWTFDDIMPKETSEFIYLINIGYVPWNYPSRGIREDYSPVLNHNLKWWSQGLFQHYYQSEEVDFIIKRRSFTSFNLPFKDIRWQGFCSNNVRDRIFFDSHIILS